MSWRATSSTRPTSSSGTQTTHRKYFANIPKAQEIDIPKLNEMAYEQVDLAGVTFKDFIDNRAADGQPGKFSFVLRGYVRKWCSEIDEEFAHVKLMQDLLTGGRGTPAGLIAPGAAMASHFAVHIVCSDRHRNGKTLLARVLVDFLLLDGRDPFVHRHEPSGRHAAQLLSGPHRAWSTSP